MKSHTDNYKILFFLIVFILILSFLILYFGKFDFEEKTPKKLIDNEGIEELSKELPDSPLSMPPSYDEGTSPNVLP